MAEIYAFVLGSFAVMHMIAHCFSGYLFVSHLKNVLLIDHVN